MRLPVTCWTCLSENLRRENLAAKRWVEPERHLLELRDDGAYLWTCSRGHTESFALQNLRHEVLYEAGGVALLCGFHREAISSMSTALERFYEFAIFVFAEHHGTKPEDVEITWKEVSRQSERQLGAFYLLYLTTFGRSFALPREAKVMTELRNEVVHKGKIPTRDEAQTFAKYVFNTVREISRELDELDASAVELVRKRRLAMHYEKLEKRRANELSEAKRKGMHLRYGMMLKPWVGVHPGKAGDFVWCLEALAYRIKQTGAGTLSEDRPFTRFDPEDD
jgi:hypothetical protein